MRILWVAMMAVWLAGLAGGAWWAWPRPEGPRLTADLVMTVVWLVIGAVAWVVALNLGIARYWRGAR